MAVSYQILESHGAPPRTWEAPLNWAFLDVFLGSSVGEARLLGFSSVVVSGGLGSILAAYAAVVLPGLPLV